MQYHFILEISYFKWIITILLRRRKSRRKMIMRMWNPFWFWWWISAFFSAIYCGMATWHSAAQRIELFLAMFKCDFGCPVQFSQYSITEDFKYRCLNPLAETDIQMSHKKLLVPNQTYWEGWSHCDDYWKRSESNFRAARAGSGLVTNWRQLL